MSPPRSKAWNCFKKKNGSEAICKVCSNIIKYSGNTSNLFKHLKKPSNLPLTATTVDNVTVEIDSSQAILNRHLSEPIEPSTSKSSDTSTNLSSEIASSHTLEEEMVDSPLPARLVVKRPIVESFKEEAAIYYKRFHKRLATHSNPLVKTLSSNVIPGNPPRRLKRNWCRDMLT